MLCLFVWGMNITVGVHTVNPNNARFIDIYVQNSNFTDWLFAANQETIATYFFRLVSQSNDVESLSVYIFDVRKEVNTVLVLLPLNCSSELVRLPQLPMLLLDNVKSRCSLTLTTARFQHPSSTIANTLKTNKFMWNACLFSFNSVTESEIYFHISSGDYT